MIIERHDTMPHHPCPGLRILSARKVSMAMVPGMEEQPTSSVLSYLRAYTRAAATLLPALLPSLPPCFRPGTVVSA